MRLQYAYQLYECAIWHTNRKVCAMHVLRERKLCELNRCVWCSHHRTSSFHFLFHINFPLCSPFFLNSSFDLCVSACADSLGYKSFVALLTDERFSNYHWNPDDKINKTIFRTFFSLTFFVRRNFSVQLHLCLVCICAIIFFLSAVLMLIPRRLRFIYCLLFAFQVLCVSLRNYRIPGTQAMCIQFKHNGHPILRNGIIRKRSNKQTTFGSRDKTRKAASQRRREKTSEPKWTWQKTQT